MIQASDFLDPATERGYGLYTGVPCSFLKPFINHVIAADDLHYVGAANEGDAVAVAAGSELAGRRAITMFQNSGLGNAISPLSSLTETFRIPVLLIVTHRGEPGETPDEPQHQLMGRVTPELLDLLGIPWERFPTDAARIPEVLDRADRWMDDHELPYALLMSHGSVEPAGVSSDGPTPGPVDAASVPPRLSPVARRAELLRAVQAATGPADLLVATTGYTGRELYSLHDAPNQLYMVGSMGCAPSLGLGIALVDPDHRVIVLDGDGAALMRLGALTMIGNERPANLVHVLFDNGQHESTGGQRTATDTTDLAAVAAGCGYTRVERATDPDHLASLLQNATDGPCFIHVPVRSGVLDPLPRPEITPPEVAARFRHHVASSSRPGRPTSTSPAS